MSIELSSLLGQFPLQEDPGSQLFLPPPPEPEPENTAPVLSELKQSERREYTVERLLKVYDTYKEHRESEIEPIWSAVYRAYRGYKPARGPYKSQYVIREVFRQVESLKPQIHRQFFSGDQLFNYAPMHPGQEIYSQAATEIVHQQIYRNEIDRELMFWLDNTVLYGISYLHYGWRKFKRVKYKISSMHAKEEKTWWQRETEDILIEAPAMDFIPPWEIYTHPYVEDPRESPVVYWRRVVSPNDLKTLVREGWLDKDLTRKAVEAGGATGYSALEELGPPGESREDLQWRLDKADEPQELLVCYTNDGMEYAILNGKHLVRATKCPYGEAPIISQPNYPQAGEHYGIPEPLVILDDQRLLNDFMGMYVDTVHYTLNPMWKLHRRAAKDFHHTTFRPGGKIILDDMNDLQPLAVNPTAMDLQAQAQFILRNMKLATGLSDELAGMGSNQKTATGLVRLQDAAGARMEHKVKLFMPRFKQVYATLYLLNAMYLDEPTAVRLQGADGKFAFSKHNPDVFQADVDVQIELANMMEAGPEAAAKWQNLYKLVGQDPRVDAGLILQRMFRAMGEKRPKMFMASPVTSQADAMEENEAFKAYGYIPDPNPQEDHQQHLQVHQMFMQTQDFQAMSLQQPLWAEMFARHVGVHGAYVQQMQQANQQAQQAPTNPEGQGAPLPQANDMANQMFDMAQDGSMGGGGF